MRRSDGYRFSHTDQGLPRSIFRPVSGFLPVVVVVSFDLPGGHFLDQRLLVGDASVEALPSQHR